MNDNIKVFGYEKSDGLEDQIKKDSSLAYVSQVCPVKPDSKKLELNEIISSVHNKKPYKKAMEVLRSKAGLEDDDVYQTFSILVSASWNRNDDVFNKEEVWAAKETPRYKPANLEHDEKQIVGGIIGSWPVNDDFSLIDDNMVVEDLPDFYHILVSSVIYRQWQDPEYQARAEELIKKIENGEMFVSMECLFRGFDYAVVAPDNKNHIIARNEETSFLTRHLRSYGGTGKYQDHKVGRLLKNITFSGKGFVEKPANPDSIIFDSDRSFDFSNACLSKNPFLCPNGVSVKVEEELFSSTERQENLNMSTDILNTQIGELREALADVQAENKELSDKLSKANVETWEKQIAELTAQIESLEGSIAESNNELESEVSKSEELEAKLAAAVTARTEAEDLVQAMQKEKATADRTATLIEAGLSEEEAAAKIETFDGLSDEQFAAVAETLKSAYMSKKKANKEKEADDEDKKDTKAEVEAEEANTEAEDEVREEASEVDEEVLETASVEETIDMSVASDNTEDETSHVRANLREWVNTYVLNQELGE
jgi:predicted  nucleic acid-binding Zn-ribbon protein